MKLLDTLRLLLGIGDRRLRAKLGLGDRRAPREIREQQAREQLEALAYVKYRGRRLPLL